MKRLLTILCIPALLLLGAISWPAAAAATPQNSDRLETKPACVQSPIWNDKGSGADLDGFFFIPAVEQSFFMIGGYGSQTNAPRQSCVLSVRESAGNPSGAPKLLTPPKDWELIWADKGSGADQDGSFWKAIPPSSEYRCLGSVPQAGYGKPSIATYRCVHSSLTQPVSISELVWSDKGSGADKDVTLFKLPNTGSFVAVSGKASQADVFDIKPDATGKPAEMKAEAKAKTDVPPTVTAEKQVDYKLTTEMGKVRSIGYLASSEEMCNLLGHPIFQRPLEHLGPPFLSTNNGTPIWGPPDRFGFPSGTTGLAAQWLNSRIDKVRKSHSEIRSWRIVPAVEDIANKRLSICLKKLSSTSPRTYPILGKFLGYLQNKKTKCFERSYKIKTVLGDDGTMKKVKVFDRQALCADFGYDGGKYRNWGSTGFLAMLTLKEAHPPFKAILDEGEQILSQRTP